MAKKNETKEEVTLQPLGDRVLILPDKIEEKKTETGIILPESEQNISGTVVAIGPGHYVDGEFVEVGVTFGDRVLLGKFGHEEVFLDGKKYYIVSEGALLGIIE